MNQYYLISQLPSLDAVSDAAPLPITEERFNELCSRFLSKKALKALNGLTLLPPRNAEKSSFSFIDEWNEGERKLRLALANIRAGKMKKSFDNENNSFSAQILQAARTATETDDPLEAERLLNRFRLDFSESLRPSDTFSEDYVFYYGLKLKLLLRMRSFEENRGREEYQKIYDSIMRGDGQEVEQ